ncbi:hypothetical protein Pla22_20870 [Rubripirellula amarantea]|uniref:Uncharacterized protein n=1 Tax=Rubripirellula amarantea TaxID=2527999 RepID=A0A5C5WV54_9BACT|nr:hypothetical protein Pla22_20870 [Rubripirellula amarantea]
MGKFRFVCGLPARLTNARNLPSVGVFTEANTAQAELAINATGTSAEVTAILFTGAELRGTLCLGDFGFASHSEL